MPTVSSLAFSLSLSLCVIQYSSSQDSVIGVVIADGNGLCMGSSGSFQPAASGHVQSILDVASQLSEEGEHPIIQVQGAQTEILISHIDGYTTAVARAIPFNMEQQAAATAGSSEQGSSEQETLQMQ